MGKYWVLLGQYGATTTSYTAFAGTPASPYTPTEDAKLIGLRVIVNRSAATSLINHVQFKLTCSTFKPNSIEVGGQGTGLQTAPAAQGGETSYIDWAVEQLVKAGVPITMEGRNVTADTPVTVSVLLYGCFIS